MLAEKSMAIDVVKLFAEGDSVTWNAWLKLCFERSDVPQLVDVLRRLQMGMDRAVRDKMNLEKINVAFIRWQRSIENTIRDIHRKKNPNPLFVSSNDAIRDQFIDDKKAKQEDLERFLRRARY